MRAPRHIVASTVFSSGIYFVTRSPVISVSSFFIGIFLDLDHLFDYWNQHPGSMDVHHFVETCNNNKINIMVLFLHSYELFAACAIMAFLTKSSLLFGISLGFAQHLFLDTLGNPINDTYLSYFFLYRWHQGFDLQKIFKIDTKNGKDNNI